MYLSVTLSSCSASAVQNTSDSSASVHGFFVAGSTSGGTSDIKALMLSHCFGSSFSVRYVL